MEQRRQGRKVRDIIIGTACFALASFAVRADNSSSVPPGHIDAIADGADQSQTVHVNGSGELSSNDSGARDQLSAVNAKLAPLGFDGNGLRVSAQGHVTVEGSVTVANMPAQQAVTGTVSVSNFPATMPVSGTVSITNLPDTQNVNIVNGGVQATTGGFAAAHFYLVNDGTLEVNYLAARAAHQPFTTQRFQQLLPTLSPVPVTLITLSSDHDVHMTCRNQGVTMFVLANGSQNQRQEFVHPLMVDECYIECINVIPNGVASPPNCLGIVTIAGLGPSLGAATGTDAGTGNSVGAGGGGGTGAGTGPSSLDTACAANALACL